MNISAADILFLVMAAFTGGAGLMLALTRNVVRAGFWLFAVLFGIAGLFVFAGAEFLAMSQVILYVGGILVLLLFGIMLTQKVRDLDPRTEITSLVPGLLLSVALFAGCHFLISGYSRESSLREFAPIEPQMHSDVEQTGMSLITDYLLPFEVVSVLLLAALIGAAYLSRKGRQKGGEA